MNPCECGLFSRSQWPYSLHIFSLVSLVKKCATCKAIVTFQRGPIHTESTFTVFFFHSLTYITINVRHIHCTITFSFLIFYLSDITFLIYLEAAYILHKLNLQNVPWCSIIIVKSLTELCTISYGLYFLPTSHSSHLCN